MTSALFNRTTALIIALSILGSVEKTDARRRSRAQAEPKSQAPPEPSYPPPNDTAKFLAGMAVPLKSPLAPLTHDPAWKSHRAYFEKAFTKMNDRQLGKLHTWVDTYLPEAKDPVPVAYYMFSGPDFLYVDQFFPNASVYILCGKESMGPPPDPLRIANLPGALRNLENAMKSSLATSYFITQDMKVDLQRQELNGTLPIFFVFLARANKSIEEVTFGSLNRDGTFQERVRIGGETPGVRIHYIDNHTRRRQTMYYFTTDISDGGIGSNPAFLNFCHHFGVGASFLKSSSYLMFEDGFARIRNFILDHSNLIVQDDSGIPLDHFNRSKWNVRFFGTYEGPIELFRQHYQPRLREEFAQGNSAPLTIGFGYQWNFHRSNLIVAERR